MQRHSNATSNEFYFIIQGGLTHQRALLMDLLQLYGSVVEETKLMTKCQQWSIQWSCFTPSRKFVSGDIYFYCAFSNVTPN